MILMRHSLCIHDTRLKSRPMMCLKMILTFLILIAKLHSSMSCLHDPDSYYNYVQFITVNEGDSPKLACYDTGDPYLPIKWHREPTTRNFTLPNGELSCDCGNVLELSSITKHQRGRYFCNTNSILINTSRYIKVNVNFQPSILETRRIDHFESKEIELNCNVEAYPPPEILWMKNNIILSSNKQYQIIIDADCDDVYNATIVISMEYHYSGIYVCRITNKFGQLFVTHIVTNPPFKTYLPADYDGMKGP